MSQTLTKQEMKNFIVLFIADNPGIKATQLVIHPYLVMNEFDISFDKAIDELVNNKEIIEIEYVAPKFNRIKSLYFPIGTEFTFKSTKGV